jgi:hypothetical protein
LSEIPQQTLDGLRGLEVLALDCLRIRAHPTHLSLTASIASAATTSTSAQREDPVAASATATQNVARDRETQATTTEDDYADEDVIGADDPASFVNFLMSLASNAAASLGMMEHPVTGQRGADLALGKHWIDVLGMLKQKTQGNLTAQEQEIFEGLLAELRMQFVSLNTTAPSTPRGGGFTGRDITGGK